MPLSISSTIQLIKSRLCTIQETVEKHSLKNWPCHLSWTKVVIGSLSSNVGGWHKKKLLWEDQQNCALPTSLLKKIHRCISAHPNYLTNAAQTSLVMTFFTQPCQQQCHVLLRWQPVLYVLSVRWLCLNTFIFGMHVDPVRLSDFVVC